MLSPLTVAIIGCGLRGGIYASYATHYPDKLKVVAVAEHNDIRRRIIAQTHGISDNKYIAKEWTDLASLPKFCDAVIIATQDQYHFEPAIAFSNLKYHILLEKPMSNNLKECELIHESVIKNGIMMSIGLVMRYSPISLKIKELIDTGVIGNIISIQHLEPVGYHHFTHSYVRGNWRNETLSSFALMAKCCHDIDLIMHFLGGIKWTKVASFGSLNHFRKEKKPKEAGDIKKCLDCPIQDSCAASAKSIYLDGYKNKDPTTYWMVERITNILDIENVTDALKNGPYGKCVYECDNDVCDNQVVNIEFEGSINVSFMMMAFTELECKRQITIFGDRGEIKSDGGNILTFYDFLKKQQFEFNLNDSTKDFNISSHGGGDYMIVENFIKAIKLNDPSYILCNSAQALESHKLVFAAEEARKNNKIIFNC